MKTERTRHIHVPPSSRAGGDGPTTVHLPSAPAPAAAPPPGPLSSGEDLFSLYAVQSKIGDGGMGIVFLAKDRRLGRFVAIKRLSHQAQGNPSLRSRFLQEARAVAALNHIHIVHIYGLGEDADGPYIVMEYVPGPLGATGGGRAGDTGQPNPPVSLDRQVSRNGQYTFNEAIELLLKISKAIAYAHGCGVIHRDLKPSNVLLDETCEPKIVDFGLARLMREEESKLTTPGEKLLSLGYGAPEQESDASITDERADVYGLGALLYFAITGQNPRYFREQDIPVPLRDVLVKALATDREQRWPSAAAFMEALQAVQSRTRVETPTAKTTWRCKWCDTVNPLTIRFCSECGWDGGENCPECGAESFVGVQFCGTCGADARTYEGVTILLRRMRAAVDATEFERAAALGGRAQGFEPAGPSGRALVKEIQELRDHANRQISRREQLKELIPMELRAENYERAREFIAEYRRLSGNRQQFVEEERQLPGLTLKRDLKRAQRALHDRDWDYALHLCDSLLHEVAPDNAECVSLRHAIVRRQAFRRGARIVLAVMALFLVYLLSAPPVMRLAGSPTPATLRRLYPPARWCYRDGLLAFPLRAYARLWDEQDLEARFAPAAAPAARAGDAAQPSELTSLQTYYAGQLREIESAQRQYAATWPETYKAELDALMERRRAAGDYEEWRALDTERQQFGRTGAIGAHSENDAGELLALKQKFREMVSAASVEHARRIVAESKKYINDLSGLQSRYTKDARMGDAALVNNEIKRVRATQEIRKAEEILADFGSHVEGEPAGALSATPVAADRLAELRPLRDHYEEQLDAAEADYARNMEQWPGKYVAALNLLMENYRTAGDYSGWQTVKNEVERFSIDRSIQTGQLASEPAKLVALQREYLKQAAGFRATRARAIVELALRQIESLTE
ncbi:MAG: serine/threonine-protein kinase, partial [Kiritimatiellae bacterium]|nr:serine/threonine-protein kinase [Kiritimatiellia bacterium]